MSYSKNSDRNSLQPTDFSISRGYKQKGNLNNPLPRGLFKDIVLNKVINADVNAAANPVKTKSTHELTQLIKRNNDSNKLKLVG